MVALTFLGSFGVENDAHELLSEFELQEGFVGSGEGCWLRFPVPSMRGQHFRFLEHDGAWFIAGVEVTRATWNTAVVDPFDFVIRVGDPSAEARVRVNGKTLKPEKAVMLQSGDVIETAHTRLRFGPAVERIEIDLSTLESAMISADLLSERGHPAGHRLALRQQGLDGWLEPRVEGALDADALALTFRFGMIVGARVGPEGGAIHLRLLLLSLLNSPLAVGLEELTVDVGSFGQTPELGDTLEWARRTCQAVVEAGPPSLRVVNLGVVEALDIVRLERDWSVLRRRFPRVPELLRCVRFGRPFIVIEALGEGRGAEVGARVDVASRPIELLFGPDPESLRVEMIRRAVAVNCNHQVTRNGRDHSQVWNLPLRDGDVVEFRGARLRLEYR
jgi:hypothetical protein